MSLKKILLKGPTRMSLHERFSFLRSQAGAESSPTTQSVRVQSIRQGLFSSQQASLKNRRLAHMMDRRPTVLAALRIKKQIMKQRLGQPQQRLSVKDRLTLRGRFRGGLRGRIGQRGLRGRIGQRDSVIARSPLVRQQLPTRGGRGNRRGARGNFIRSQSMTNLSRSQSVQSLSGRRNLSTGGSRPTRGGRGRYINRNTYNHQEFRRGGRGFRSRGGNYYRNNDLSINRRGGRNSYFNNRGTQRARGRGFRSRGGRPGRGVGGRGRGRGRGPAPTKEELDSQLDQYMATSRHELDRELDSYMSHQETWD